MPSALHEAVTRAIASAQYTAPDNAERDLRLARAAIGVCLAEAQRAVEALPARSYAPSIDAPQLWLERDQALAVLAALAEEQACPCCHAGGCPECRKGIHDGQDGHA